MEWIVCDVIYMAKKDIYLLKLQAGPLNMMAEVLSTSPIYKDDKLHPIKDAKYLVNKNESRPVKVIFASEYSASHWLSQKRICSHKLRQSSLLPAT
ncbi:polymyxin B resistance protein pmrD [Klebsiella variicola]|uniref:polymyxin B resistance protein pmrD n=1 Tax=Klebsiella variicola TaxID=244366 RepID=UPI003D3179E6